MEASTLHKLTSKVPTLTRKLDLSKLEVSFPYPLSPLIDRQRIQTQSLHDYCSIGALFVNG